MNCVGCVTTVFQDTFPLLVEKISTKLQIEDPTVYCLFQMLGDKGWNVIHKCSALFWSALTCIDLTH